MNMNDEFSFSDRDSDLSVDQFLSLSSEMNKNTVIVGGFAP